MDTAPREDRLLKDRLGELFDEHRREDGSPHTKAEVARYVAQETGEKCSRTYIGALLSGDRDNPTLRVLQAIAKFFGVDPGRLVGNQESADVHDLAAAMADAGVDGVMAVRLRGSVDGMSPDQKAHFASLLADYIQRATQAPGAKQEKPRFSAGGGA